jgi:hypothetical protein
VNLRRVVTVAAATMALAVAVAPIASADPAKPGNYRSIVEWVTPRTDAVTAKVVGGDGFLELEVVRGHTVEVPGYTGEPWLRVLADGRVEENQRSQTTYINQNRYGSAATVQIPVDATIANATEHPEWKTVDTNGRYVWHDHRIHYMTPSIKPTIIPGTRRVAIGERDDGRWVVRLTVDGTPTQIVGELLKEPAPNGVVPWLLVALVATLLGATGWLLRSRAGRVAAGALVVAGALALLSGFRELAVVPAQAGGNPIAVALPAIAIVIALLALVLRAAAGRSIAVLASAAALSVWAVLRVPSFDKAVPLGDLAPALTRQISAGALGAAIGAAVAAIASGGLALRLADFDDDADDGDGDPQEPVGAAADLGDDAPSSGSVQQP